MVRRSKEVNRSTLFKYRRYWYHLSTTLNNKRHYLTPWDNDNEKAINRGGYEPNVKRTCVAPSVEHCLAAIPYSRGEKFTIYRTAHRIIPTPATEVFDRNVTQEGWVQIPMLFVRVGTLSLPYVAKMEGREVIGEAASSSNPRQSGKVLKWWKTRKLHRYIKPS